MAPVFGPAHRRLITATGSRDRLKAVRVAMRLARRFEHSPDAWVALGRAHLAAFRQRDALVAFERGLLLEERPDAAMAAGELYARRGDYATAGARYARAYAAGGGPDALRANAKALQRAGDGQAAQRAIELWESETGERWADAAPE